MQMFWGLVNKWLGSLNYGRLKKVTSWNKSGKGGGWVRM